MQAQHSIYRILYLHYLHVGMSVFRQKIKSILAPSLRELFEVGSLLYTEF